VFASTLQHPGLRRASPQGGSTKPQETAFPARRLVVRQRRRQALAAETFTAGVSIMPASPQEGAVASSGKARPRRTSSRRRQMLNHVSVTRLACRANRSRRPPAHRIV